MPFAVSAALSCAQAPAPVEGPCAEPGLSHDGCVVVAVRTASLPPEACETVAEPHLADACWMAAVRHGADCARIVDADLRGRCAFERLDGRVETLTPREWVRACATDARPYLPDCLLHGIQSWSERHRRCAREPWFGRETVSAAFTTLRAELAAQDVRRISDEFDRDPLQPLDWLEATLSLGVDREATLAACQRGRFGSLRCDPLGPDFDPRFSATPADRLCWRSPEQPPWF